MTSPRAGEPFPFDSGLVDQDQARAYQDQRTELCHRLPPASVLKLDQQLLWWHVHDLFDRFGSLGGFDLASSSALVAWLDEGGRGAFRGLRVKLYRTGQAAPVARVPRILAPARRELDSIMEGFARIQPYAFLDLVDTLLPCRRHGLVQWGQGWLDGHWLAAVKAGRLERALPDPPGPRPPGPRL